MKLARMRDTCNHRDFYPLIQIKRFSLKILVHPIIRKRRNVEWSLWSWWCGYIIKLEECWFKFLRDMQIRKKVRNMATLVSFMGFMTLSTKSTRLIRSTS